MVNNYEEKNSSCKQKKCFFRFILLVKFFSIKKQTKQNPRGTLSQK